MHIFSNRPIYFYEQPLKEKAIPILVTEGVRLMKKKKITPNSQKCRLKCSREAVKDDVTFLGTSAVPQFWKSF